ncbi:MAG: ribose-phosphate diphosphokinase, partial [Planctomycetota bacterium]|nr:ribose-phosphate diphosphokinase [Planctomycetota bacterium]
GSAIQRLQDAPITGVVLTDTIPLPADQKLSKMHIRSVAPLLGEAVKRIHQDESISAIFRDGSQL